MNDETSQPFPVLSNPGFSDEAAAAMFKALAHPARIAILRRLCCCEQCLCGEIVEELPLAQSTVSEHLRILKEAGLARVWSSGTKRCYCVDRDRLERAGRLVAELLGATKS